MRDFFYNKGDVLIAVLIIIVAAVIIYFRVGVVMDSEPGEKLKSLFAPLITAITGEKSPDEEPAAEEPVASEPVTPEATEPSAGTDTAQEQTPVVEEPPVQEEPPAEPPPAAAADIKITIAAGDIASTIADKLLAAGAITDKQAFLAEVDAQNAASKLKQGTFTIPAGSSAKDIVSILVG